MIRLRSLASVAWMEALDALERSRYADLLRANHGLPVIAGTANAMREARQECLDAGMDDYLTKPYRERELARVLKRFILPEKEAEGP